MEALKESQDQKRRELARLGAGKLGRWGLSWVPRRGSNRQRERSYGEVQGRSPEQDSIGKGTKRHRNHEIMIRPDPKEAFGKLGVQHNYAPEGLQFQYATRWEGSSSFRAPDTGADKTSVQ